MNNLLLWAVCALPLTIGLITFLIPVDYYKRQLQHLSLLVALAHLLFTLFILFFKPSGDSYLFWSGEGGVLLLLISTLFLMAIIYLKNYFHDQEVATIKQCHAWCFLFLGAMSLTTLAHNIILFWVAIELTTLVSAPLIYTHKSKTSLEATWKYIILCSIGIAFALLGIFFVVMSLALIMPKEELSLTFSNFILYAPKMNRLWLELGLIFVLIGFGTKMGLAPMHSWLPDAHSEAPSPISALLSGALLNCAFLGIYRVYEIVGKSSAGAFGAELLISFGLLSIFFATIFMIRQNDYKRLLAYSSVENMGIIAFGTGIGGIALVGVYIHLIHHSLIKSSLFMTTGNLLKIFKSKEISKSGELATLHQGSFSVLLIGVFALVGGPPFGIFFSKLYIIIGAISQKLWWQTSLFLVMAAIITLTLLSVTFKISFHPLERGGTISADKKLLIWPQLFLLLCSLLLGLYYLLGSI
ncbi:MAG: hydrogenase [Oligoflexia bacterium]|nr:hydrogenase [Oligoflexia bacterium]MBF0365176.1 hydrogenase [Oligoflexia bacterium]